MESNRSRILTFVLCFLLTGFLFGLDLFIPHGVANTIIYIGVILFSLAGHSAGATYFLAGTISLLIMAGLLFSPPEGVIWEDFINRLLTMAIIWLTAVFGVHFREAQKAQKYLLSLVDSADAAIFSKTTKGIVTSWNKGAEALYGYKADEMIGQPISKIFPDDRKDEGGKILQKIGRGERIRSYETRRQRKDGEEVDVLLAVSPVRGMFNKVQAISVIAYDISKLKKAERELVELNKRLTVEKDKLEQVLSLEEGLNKVVNIDQMVDFVVHKTMKVLNAEKCSLMLLDEKTKELCIRGHGGIDGQAVSAKRVKLGEPIAGKIAAGGKPVLVVNIEDDPYFGRDNAPYYKTKSFMSAPIKLDDKLLGVMNVSDKTTDAGVFTALDLKILSMIVRQVGMTLETSKLYRELKYLAVTDPLTGMYNYRHFSKSLDQEIGRAQRYQTPLCLLMIDLDDFKSYNDRFGHLEGDEALRKIAAVLTGNLRKVDTACRYAGDEFVIILPQTNVGEAEKVADKIRDNIHNMPLKQPITVSIGVAGYQPKMDRYSMVLRADGALYKAKEKGKNQIEVYQKQAG